MAASSLETGGSNRYFSGDTEDAQEYRRWKNWVKNKILTMDKLPTGAAGPYVYTLLTGKALECVEHLSPEEYQKEGGDQVLFQLLDTRFPDKDKTDELGEMMNEIFQLRNNSGETLKGWIGRSSELFDRLKRKTGISFPEECRGWLILNRCGLTEQEKAVVLARCNGNLKREEIGKALRSCFPDMTLSRKATAVHAVEELEAGLETDPEIEFHDIELFLAEHGQSVPESLDPEEFPESEVAEVLAISWKERRAEINRLQKARKFQQVKEMKRQFRVEIEEIKKKSRCNRCQKLGHWARECPSKGKGSGKGLSKSSPPSTGAALVEACATQCENDDVHFVAMVSPALTLLDRLRNRANDHADALPEPPKTEALPSETLLVSSPGFGVLDSGCGRSIIGIKTFEQFSLMWQNQQVPVPVPFSEINHFRYGNGEQEVSTQSVRLPVYIAGRKGTIKAALVQGTAPLLISRPALRTIQAKIDFEHDQMTAFADQKSIPLQTNEAGQYILNVMKTQSNVQQPDVEVMTAETSFRVSDPNVEIQECSPLEEPIVPATDVSADDFNVLMKTQEDWGSKVVPTYQKKDKLWKYLCRRIVRNRKNRKILFDESVTPYTCARKNHALPSDVEATLTEFHFRVPQHLSGDLSSDEPPFLSEHQCRQVKAQIRACDAVQSDPVARPLVVEVFSPPRFAPVAKSRGFSAKSIDLTLGVDLSIAENRRKLKQELKESPPDLLVLCPPCTHEGGWFHLNATKMDALECLRLRARSRMFVRFCCELYRQQVALGGRAVFEHPKPSQIWKYPEVASLCRKHHVVSLHMCAYGMKLPSSENFIQKATRLLVSHEDMQSLGRTCPGASDPAHKCHDVVAGHDKEVGRVSTFAGKYPKQFVQAVLNTVPRFQEAQEVLAVTCDSVPEICWDEIHAVSTKPEPSVEELKQALTKLHRNLGHPPNADLVRVLRFGQASSTALQLAKDFACPFCESRAKPKAPMPAKVDRVVGFNKQIGLDVKFLPGWKPNQRVKALNVVCHGSSFQRMIPFFETETSQLLRRRLDDHWISWAGVPEEIILDPAQTNMAEPVTGKAEDQGCTVRQIAAGAHWQLGKTENHGGWFERILKKVIDQHHPTSKEAWLECVVQAHVKNTMIQVHGHTPHQYVFGQNPRVPTDLLDEPQSVVPATVSLTDQAIAKAQEIRTTARKAVLELQDDVALRKALNARPRVVHDYKSGDLVAYWRNQKWVQGVLNNDGRWYGSAIVLGYVGRNLVLAHRKQILRCAPEQGSLCNF